MSIKFERGDDQQFRPKMLMVAQQKKKIVISWQGIHVGILEHVDLIVPSINDALDLFIDADSLAVSMKV